MSFSGAILQRYRSWKSSKQKKKKKIEKGVQFGELAKISSFVQTGKAIADNYHDNLLKDFEHWTATLFICNINLHCQIHGNR